MNDLAAMVRQLKRDGYQVKKARRAGHWHVRDKDGRLLGVLSSTSVNYRHLRNFRSQLRRAVSAR